MRMSAVQERNGRSARIEERPDGQFEVWVAERGGMFVLVFVTYDRELAELTSAGWLKRASRAALATPAPHQSTEVKAAAVPPECNAFWFSSRVCERGTRACEVQHEATPAPHQET